MCTICFQYLYNNVIYDELISYFMTILLLEKRYNNDYYIFSYFKEKRGIILVGILYISSPSYSGIINKHCKHVVSIANHTSNKPL